MIKLLTFLLLGPFFGVQHDFEGTADTSDVILGHREEMFVSFNKLKGGHLLRVLGKLKLYLSVAWFGCCALLSWRALVGPVL